MDTGCGPEFVSDDFDPSGLNPDDLEREMKQLGMEDGAGEVPEWEKELQQELQVGLPLVLTSYKSLKRCVSNVARFQPAEERLLELKFLDLKFGFNIFVGYRVEFEEKFNFEQP